MRLESDDKLKFLLRSAIVDYENDRIDEAERKLTELVDSFNEVPPEVYEHLYLIHKYDRQNSGDAATYWNKQYLRRVESLAQQGNPQWLLKLAYMNQFADRVPKNFDYALSTFMSLAEDGEPEAQYHLSTLYSGGKCGLRADQEMYVYWLEKAADNQYPEAQSELSMIILSSESATHAEKQKAHAMLREAAQNGSKIAEEYLEQLGD